MSKQIQNKEAQNEIEGDLVEQIEEISTKQKFTIFVGTYEGAILGLVGDLGKLDLKYAFKPSTNSLKCMDICGKYLCVGGFDEYLRVYDLRRQRECGILEAHLGTITSIKSHQSIVFSSAEDGNIMAWKMKEFGLLHTLKEHKAAVHDIAVHKSGKIMVSVAKDQRLIIWNLINAKKMFSMNLKYNAYKLEITEKHIITMSDYSIHVIDQQTNQEVCELKQEKQVTLNDFCVYNQVLVVTGDNNGYIHIYDIDTKQSICFRAHETRVKKLQICRIDDIDIIISISTSGEIHLFDCLVIFNDVFEIQESRELKDLKPIYKVNTLNRLTTLSVYMDAAKDKPTKENEQDAIEKQKQLELDNLLKKQEEEKKKKKKNSKKIKVTIEKENADAKTYVIDSSKIAKKIEKKKKKQLKKQQKAAIVKGQPQKQQQQHFNKQKAHQQQQQQSQKAHQQEQQGKKKEKKSVRFQ